MTRMTRSEMISVVSHKSATKEQEAGVAPGSRDGDENFDPYDYGMEDGYGLWGAGVHIIRISFGAGILLLPHVMKTVGYVAGTATLLIVGLFYYHNIHILISHEYRLCKLLNVKQITYATLAERTFERAPFPFSKVGVLIGRLMFVYFCLTAYNSTYLLVFATSVQNLAKYFDCDVGTGYVMSVAMIPVVAICMFRRLLKILVPFSAVTNCFSLIMAVVLVACCVVYRKPEVSVRPFGDARLLPQNMALCVQAFTCTCSILPIKNYMKNPRLLRSSCGALNVSAAILTFLFVSFALVSYLCYGDDVQQNILSNLPSNNFLSFLIYLLYAFAMFVIYLLSFSVTFDNVWPDVEKNLAGKRVKFAGQYAVKLALIAWSYLLPLAIPNLGLILTISGTFAVALEIGLIPVLELVLVLNSPTKSIRTIVKDAVIIAISTALFYLSFVDCVKQVVSLNVK